MFEIEIVWAKIKWTHIYIIITYSHTAYIKDNWDL